MEADVVWTLEGDEASWGEWALARAGAAASPLVRELIDTRPAGAGGWALDLGCGTGRAFAPLVAAGYCVVGVDPTPQAVAASRRRAVDEDLPAWVVQASAARLPFAASTMAFLFAVGSLFHLSEYELDAALDELRRVMKAGGRAVLHFLDIEDWRSTLAPQAEAGEAPVPAYRAIVTCFASEEAIRHWLETADLQILSLELRTSVSQAGEQRNWIATCRRPHKE